MRSTIALGRESRRSIAGALTPRAIDRDCAEFPPQLRDLEDAPRRVWIVGDAAIGSHTPIVAVVGTRDATPYGERVTRDLVTALGRGGACIVSGMARGIDSIGHRAALECGAPTIAVLGTGVDIAYPASNRQLYGQIAERGLLMSENPPGARAHRGSFLLRNRIIAAMASVTIVVEGGHLSGALNTAEHADGLSRTVGAVPGPIDSPQSEGTNRLIRDGMHAIASIADALFLAGISVAAPATVRFRSEGQRLVWEALVRPALSLDLLCSRVGLPTRECLEAVTALELQGAVECALTGEVRRRV